MKLACAAVNRFTGSQDMLQRFQDILAFLFIICAQCAFEFCCIGNDIGIVAGLELAERKDNAIAVSPFVVYIVLNLGDNGYAHLDGADAV